MAFAMVAATGNVFFGLWYPIAVALFAGMLGYWIRLPKEDELSGAVN